MHVRSENFKCEVFLSRNEVCGKIIKFDFYPTLSKNQVVIAQWLAQRHATGEVPGSNPGKGENLLISD